MSDKILAKALGLTSKIQATNAAVSAVMIDRAAVLTALWTAISADCAIFLLGDPGVAKTETVQILSSCLKGVGSYTALMPAIGSPQAMFVDGVSIREKTLSDGSKDISTNETPGRAATAHLVIADEIWKVKNPEVLQALLDLARVQGVRHEGKLLDDHARGFVGISNETPEPGSEFDALWARMILRLNVSHLELPGLKRMVKAQIDRDRNGKREIVIADPITLEDLDLLQAGRSYIEVDESILEQVYQIIVDLNDQHGEEFKWLVSDNRRFGYMIRCLQAHALINGRPTVSSADLTILRWMLWNTSEQIGTVDAMIDPLCRTPFGKCRELVDELLATGGIVDQVCQGQAQQAANALTQVNSCKGALTDKAKALSGAEAAKVNIWITALGNLVGIIAQGFGGSINRDAAKAAYDAVKAALN